MTEPEMLAMSVPEAARAARISRTKLYQAFAAGELKAMKIGSRTLVRPADLRAWLDAQPPYKR